MKQAHPPVVKALIGRGYGYLVRMYVYAMPCRENKKDTNALPTSFFPPFL